MPLMEVTVEISTFWQLEDGDGSSCFICGDTAYLNQIRLVLKAEKFCDYKTDYVMCQSCGELTGTK